MSNSQDDAYTDLKDTTSQEIKTIDNIEPA